MVLEDFARLISDKEKKPNRFTRAMGLLIQTAREEAGLSQAELAEKVYRRRATISDLETGKADVDTTLITMLALVLDKPITYFFPSFARLDLKSEELTSIESELIIQFRYIKNEKLQRAAIKQVKILAEMFNAED